MKKVCARLLIPALTVAVLSGSSILLANDVEPEARTAARPLLDPMFPMLETHSNLFGNISDITTDPGNFCFDAIDGASFSSGDLVAFNVFWSDTIDADSFNEYEVTLGFQVAGQRRISGPHYCAFDLAAIGNPGDALNLCCAIAITVPSLPQVLNLNWGARSTKIPNGDQLQAPLGSATLSP